MARKIEVELVGDSRSLERAFSRSQTSGQKLSRGISTLAKVAAAGAVALGAGLAVGAKKSVEAASNLEEQINKTKVVFRGSEKAILSWSKKTATSFGISERAALEATGTFGNMLVPMGFARKEAGEMSTAMVELAADMASFNNASPEETLLALRSGLAGESEPLRKFGVFLNEARVKQEALRLGLVKGNEELSDQEKAFARYSLIMKDTKDAQGDFARTSDSLANSQRTLKAVIENIGASIGKKLLPFVAEAATKLSDFLGKISRASGIKAKLRIVWLGLSGAAKDLMGQLQKVLFGGTEALRLPSGKILEWVETQGLVDKLKMALMGADWAAIGATIGENISSKVKITADFIGRILSAANAFIDSHMDQFAELGAKMLLSIVSKLTDPAFWKDNWKLILGIAITVFPLGRVASLSVKISKALLSPLAKLVPAGFRGIGARAVDAMLNVLGRLPGFVQRIFLSVVDNSIKILGQLTRWLQGVFRAALAKIPGWIKAAFRLSFALAFLNVIRDIIDAIQDLIAWIARIPSRIPTPSLPSPGGGVPFIPGVQSGGNIKRSGLAMVHRGETVTPARVQRTSFGGNGGGPGQFALVYAGGDFISWLQDQDRRTRRGNGGRGILS